jgi:hypothetical protein
MHKFERSLPTVEVEGVVYDRTLKKEVVQTVRVPIDPDKFVSTKDQFELTYLRWRYFMRAANPPTELVKKYEKAALKVAKESYNENYDAMKNSGLEVEDVCNIALVHLVSYLGCYSLQFSEIGKTKVAEKMGDVSQEEVKRKDLSNMMVFIQQRLKDLVRVFRQKNKNVLGEHLVAVLFQLVDKESPCTDMELIKAPNKYGFRRVTPTHYKEVKKKLGTYPQVGRFVLGDTVYRYVYIHNGPIWTADHENPEDIAAFNPQSSIPPQEEAFETMRRYRMEKLLDKYYKANTTNKIRMLKHAISFLKKKKMANELVLAKGLLNKLEYNEGV